MPKDMSITAIIVLAVAVALGVLLANWASKKIAV